MRYHVPYHCPACQLNLGAGPIVTAAFKAAVLTDHCFVFLTHTHGDNEAMGEPQPGERHVSLNPLIPVTICLPPLSVPLQVPALGLVRQNVCVNGRVRVYLYLLYVGGWSSIAVSRQPYLKRGEIEDGEGPCV